MDLTFEILIDPLVMTKSQPITNFQFGSNQAFTVNGIFIPLIHTYCPSRNDKNKFAKYHLPILSLGSRFIGNLVSHSYFMVSEIFMGQPLN